MEMTRERYIRLIAGLFVLTSLALAYLVSRYWLWFTTFVGFNLFQSSLTGFCPLEKVLERLGIGDDPVRAHPASAGRSG